MNSKKLVLEEYNHAINRGAKIYAEVVGAGMSADAHHITAPHPEGLGAKIVMQQALLDAKISTNKIDYINVHGTSTPLGDISEMKAIHSVFQDDIYDLTTFTDLEKSRIDFSNYDDEKSNKAAQGRRKVKAKTDGTNTFLTTAENYTDGDEITGETNRGPDPTQNFKTGVNSAAEITYPYEKPGLCSEYVMQKISYYDTSGNNNQIIVNDIKKKFPLTKFQ